MLIFIDSANIEEIKEIHELGFLSGVTTNPTLVAKEKKDYHQVIRDICALVDGPVSAEVISGDYWSMLEEAKILAALHPNVVVKIPVCFEGLKAIARLNGLGIKTNATLVFSANQALLAARAGASYVSPFIGRIDDVSHEGINLLADIIRIFQQGNIRTQIISASIRHPGHVLASSKLGAHISTIPFNIIKQIIFHPQTEEGIARFKRDWEAAVNDD
ncbi:MAG: fructose-6-phosphate aldolase [Syntrophomonadaceae bacterium]|nr:fructose-6-phosphate aldolase [Syntrophomonadaceae bacterium]